MMMPTWLQVARVTVVAQEKLKSEVRHRNRSPVRSGGAPRV